MKLFLADAASHGIPSNWLVTDIFAGFEIWTGSTATGLSATTFTATIEAIDKPASKVTLKGPEGNKVTFKVRDPKKLDVVNVGDQVQITYTRALAIAVEPAPAK
jgi:hypothetical protein